MRLLPLLVVLLFPFFFSANAQSPAKWTLETCIDYALKNNLGIQQAQLNKQLGKNNYVQSYLNLLPNISAFVSNDWTNGQQFSLAAFRVVNATTTTFATGANADLTLFSGLQQVHNILRSKQDLLAANFDVEDMRNTTVLNVTTAFLQLMNNRELLKVSENQLLTSKLQKENIEKRVLAGALPEVNLLDIEAQIARDESAVTNAKNAFELAKLGLRLILQLKPEEQFDVELPVLQKSISERISESAALNVYNTAVLQQPSIKAAMARLRSAEYSNKMAIGAFSPTLSLNASLYDYYTNQQKSFDTVANDFVTTPLSTQFKDQFRKTIGLTLSIPIFSRGQRIINLANSKIQYQQAKVQLESRKNTLLQTIFEADANARAAADAYYSSQKSYDAVKRAFDAQEKRYNTGAASNLDYQTAKNNLATVESELIRNKYTYVFRKKVLEFYEGKPISLSE